MLNTSSTDAGSGAGIKGETNIPIPHESGHKHVSGSAAFVDDYPPSRDQLFAYIGYSNIAKGKIKSIDLDAVWKN